MSSGKRRPFCLGLNVLKRPSKSSWNWLIYSRYPLWDLLDVIRNFSNPREQEQGQFFQMILLFVEIAMFYNRFTVHLQ